MENKEGKGFQEGTHIFVLGNHLDNGATYWNWKDWGKMDISGYGKQKISFKHVQLEVLLRYSNISSNYMRLDLP